MSEFSIKDKTEAAKRKKRQENIDADLARYGEAYARITIGDDGAPQMDHVPHNLVRPIMAIQMPEPKKKPQ